MNKRILIVDDDYVFLKSLKRFFYVYGYSVTTLANPNTVIDVLSQNGYHCVILDVHFPGVNGLEVFKWIKARYPALPVILISGHSSIDTAVEALKIGAYDFLEKPFDPNRLLISVNNAVEKHMLWEEKENILNELKDNYQLVGQSSAIKRIIQEIKMAAQVDAKVLITGESGVGKELVAWAIHHQSSRQGKPYIKINCAAIPSELLEAELFGYRKGAFTGAVTDSKGKLVAAKGGTIFFDEIGDMELRLQAKLLRVLEEKEVEAIGDTKSTKIDVRIIAATNKNLEKLVKEKKFRLDLFHRLNVINIYIPPLRERREDIIPLAYHFINKFNEAYNKRIVRITPLGEEILINHSWPGNVRELRNLLERIVIFNDKEEITADDILHEMDNVPYYHKAFVDRSQGIVDIHTAHQIFEKKYLILVLDSVNGNIKRAADLLGIDRSNLYKKLKKHGLMPLPR